LSLSSQSSTGIGCRPSTEYSRVFCRRSFNRGRVPRQNSHFTFSCKRHTSHPSPRQSGTVAHPSNNSDTPPPSRAESKPVSGSMGGPPADPLHWPVDTKHTQRKTTKHQNEAKWLATVALTATTVGSVPGRDSRCLQESVPITAETAGAMNHSHPRLPNIAF